ncbi:MAG: gluconate 2-dehydrogenase subunit 3 family protein [Erythrobacter sp.]|nr:gluconate 2-dehydrogenase subunit 3 family protein [Erythrobacter sp.]
MLQLADLDRRALLARTLALVGASAAASACQTLDAVAPLEAGADGGLSARQMATLRAAAGRIIPQTDTAGAIEAGVPERFAGLLAAWASPASRTALVAVIDRIDALPGGGLPFAVLPAARQHELLAAFDAEAMRPSGTFVLAFPSTRELPVDPDYARFKDLVVALYYMSQPAMTEELRYVHVPGRWDPSIPVTPETRPWGETVTI